VGLLFPEDARVPALQNLPSFLVLEWSQDALPNGHRKKSNPGLSWLSHNLT